MKRHNLRIFALDTTRNILKFPPGGGIEEKQKQIKASLISKFGDQNFDEKFARYMQLDKTALSIVAEHSYLLDDICNSYVQGSFYSALTGTCCLGERIFNNITFKVMDNFKSSKYYKVVHRSRSMNDWLKAIQILSDWNIFDKETENHYIRLYKLRTNSVHFQKKQQILDEMALESINIINTIVNNLFGIDSENKDIIISSGEFFIKKKAETKPMIKAFFIPCGFLVGPKFAVKADRTRGKFEVIDEHKYEDKEISDAQFIELRKKFKDKQ